MMYVICGTPRAGTTFLQGLLQSTHVAGYPEEISLSPMVRRMFQIPDTADILDQLDLLKKLRTTPNGVTAWQLMDPKQVETIGKPDHYIWIKRRDIVAQAVSYAILGKTYVPYREPGSKPPEFLQSLEYDRELIDETISRIEAGNAAWNAFFSEQNVVPCVVLYEDLLLDVVSGVAQVLRYLDLPEEESVKAEGRTEIQASALNADWIERYNKGQ